MVCPNCKSTDIITVQDQRFCINCGQILPIEPAGKAAGGLDGKVANEAGRGVIMKRRRGRPKAGRLDEPETRSAGSGVARPRPAAEARMGPMSGRRLSDLAPVNGGRREAVIQTAEAAPAVQERSLLDYSAIVGASFQERFRLAALVWAIWPAALLAVVAGVATWILIGPKARQVLGLAGRAGWPLWGELVLVALLFYLGRTVTSAAIMFGAARRADHRPASMAHQLGAAVNSLWSRIGFDVVVTVLQVGAVGLAAGLLLAGGAEWPVPEAVQLAALLVAYLLLTYLWVGLELVRGLGHAAVTLGRLSVRGAMRVGWGFFRRYFELVGFRFVCWLLELLLAAPLVLAVLALMLYLPSGERWLAAVMAAVLASLSGAAVGAGTAVWWETAYRSLVRRGRPGEAMRLLAGRQPERARRGAMALVLLTELVVGGLAVVWPWLPLPW